MKRIFISIIWIFVFFSFFVAGVFAWFGDMNSYPDTSFTAGTIKLDLQKVDYEEFTLNLSNIKPGDSGEWKIKNIGSLDGGLEISFSDVTEKFWDIENFGLDEFGIPVSLSSSGSDDPKLSEIVLIRFSIGDVVVENSLDEFLFEGYSCNLTAGQTLSMKWFFESAAGNEYQGASSKMNIGFALIQENE